MPAQGCGPDPWGDIGVSTGQGSLSTFDAAGLQAQWTGWLTLGMTAGVLAIFAVVMFLAARAALRHAPELRASRWIVIGGLGVPAAVLIALFAVSLQLQDALSAQRESPVLRIQVEARQWWWRVAYLPGTAPVSGPATGAMCTAAQPVGTPALPESGESAVTLANELRLPAGASVQLEITSADVIHSVWIPSLAGKMDAVPGRTHTLHVNPQRPGVYRGPCAEFCGGPHGMMALHVEVMPPASFDRWLENQRADALVPVDPLAMEGRRLFVDGPCAACHRVRGTGANGDSGPDLTHVGSRAFLAAGTLPNQPGALAGWIADPQSLKPGNHMPALPLAGRDLRAIGAYLSGLR